MRKLFAIAGALMLTAAMAVPAVATQPIEGDAENGHKVTVCHATNSFTNPYVVIQVDIAAAGGLDKVMGHYDHVTPHAKGWGDWIAAFTYDGVFYPAQGEFVAGQPAVPEVCRPPCVCCPG
ncbi:MAG: hypothetical protein PVH07_00745 [Chloroflexota bacterium]